jgi:hypothetical protein
VASPQEGASLEIPISSENLFHPKNLRRMFRSIDPGTRNWIRLTTVEGSHNRAHEIIYWFELRLAEKLGQGPKGNKS